MTKYKVLSVKKYRSIFYSLYTRARQNELILKNPFDNVPAPSLKKELIRKQIFSTREAVTSKIFEYIEMFYNSKRRHSYLGYLSPNEFEKRYNIKVSKNAVLTE